MLENLQVHPNIVETSAGENSTVNLNVKLIEYNGNCFKDGSYLRLLPMLLLPKSKVWSQCCHL